MTEVVVCAVTVAVIALAAARGHALGLRRAVGALLRRALPVVAAAAVLACGSSSRWFWPFGLATPWFAAIVVFASGWWVLRRRVDPGRAPEPRSRERLLGAALGTLVGVACAASFWLSTMVVVGLTASEPSATEQARAPWLRTLVRTANRGFVRHLPVVGTLGDELEALVLVLNADRAAQRRLARARRWDQLAELPEVEVVLVDREVRRELELVREGSLFALYRLQRHPLVLALFESDEVMRSVEGLRPTQLVGELDPGARGEAEQDRPLPLQGLAPDRDRRRP